ncbi:MAG: acetyl-CoA carboxylase biotin carboxyl carrier protein [Candidatus Zixiibacteriota bacterium]
MNENYIKRLIRLVEDSEIESLEVSSWGRKVKITQRLAPSSNGHDGSAVYHATPTAPPMAPQPPQPAGPSGTADSGTSADTSNLIAIKAPMVGTFYAAPSPEADPYVSLNEKVTAGQVVCIVEAMKLMNEIESEISGRAVEICIENGQPVEFGQTLFLIDPKG